MKNNLLNLSILIFLTSLVINCSSTQKISSNTISFDQAIQTTARSFESQLPSGTQVAVLSFSSSTPNFSEYILSELAIAIASGNKIIVIDRHHTDVIRKEMAIQMSGDISDNEIRRIGHQLGVQYVVTGSIIDIGNSYRFRVIAIDVETAKHAASVSMNINRNDQVVRTFLNRNNSRQVYRIGDFGPAGGLVFYDKGVFSNGWRYIEVAPAETELLVYIGWNREHNLEGTRNDIGFGKTNTQLMVEFLNKSGVSGHIAQLSNSLIFDGFNDWFLPSKDELNLMYINLKQRNLGNFDSNSWYYSSSVSMNYFDWQNKYYYDVIKQDFNSGEQAVTLWGGGNVQFHRARAIRYF
jgi:TolB-like protein